jgi:haloalkane dehalogenase
MEILRTPDERFRDLPEWPFAPRYVTVDGLRIHHVDEGPADADPVLLLHGEVRRAYEAPFPTRRHKAGARALPLLVPTAPDDPATPANLHAWQVLRSWDRPLLTAFGDHDPIFRGADRVLQREVPGAHGQPHTTIRGGGHFIQEDRGVELARVVVEWIAATRG